jgi:hypothetical protein
MKFYIQAAAAAAFLASAIATQAAPILDQTVTPAGHGGGFAALNSGGTATTIEQRFTVGLTGNLTEIDVALAKLNLFGGTYGTGSFDIYAATGGVISGPSLATASFSVASLLDESGSFPPFTDFTFSPFGVTAGEQLAFVFGHSGSAWLVGDVGPSAYGGFSQSTNGNFTCCIAGESLKFQTFVDTAPVTAVPEPLTMSMFAAGLLGAGGLRRRRLVRA